MNKKTILGLVGAASLSLSLSAAAPVLAAETNPTQPVTTSSQPSKDASTTTPAPTTGDQNKPSTTSQDPAKTPSTDQNKPADSQDTSKTPAKGDQSKPATGNETSKKPSKSTSDSAKALSLMGKYAKLTRNSYVYDKNGKRVKNSKLKKGTIILVSGFASPKGKTLIGFNNKKNQYINVRNVKLFKAVQYKVKKKSYVYNSKGVRQPNLYVKKGKTILAISTKKLHGKKCVQITDKYFIKWANLDQKSGKVIAE